MNRHLLLSAALVPLFGAGCDKPKADLSNRFAELEQRVAAAENEAAEARAAQQEAERMFEQQRLAVERDALERERLELERQRIEKERLQAEQLRAAEDELRQRQADIASREATVSQVETLLDYQKKSLDEREAELSERDRELAGREALPEPAPVDPAAPTTPAPEPAAVNVQVFYESLVPYGSWFDSPTYGYVWRPSTYRVSGWRPYTHGRWACTDRGWLWMSDEPFGWATYHYGRWALCRTNGWIWIPGTQWAPSWVTWRTSGTHIGWAPLPPETMAYRGRRWDSTVEATFGIGSAWFNFVETRNFGGPIHSHCLPYTRNDDYWGNTRNVTNVYFHNNRVISGGPLYGDIALQTPRKPPFYRIEEDRGEHHAKDRGYNRIENGRFVFTSPRREESRNQDAVMNQPPRVSGRLENVDVVRTRPLDQDVVREFQTNRGQTARTGAPPRDITQTQPTGRHEETRPRDRGEEQRRLNEHAQELEREARKNVDDRIRVLPRSAEDSSHRGSQPKSPATPPSAPTSRGEEQRRLNEHAEELQREARKNVDDRIRVLPRSAEDSSHRGSQPRQPATPRTSQPPAVEKPKNPPVLPRREEPRLPATPRQQPTNQQRQAEDNSRMQAEAQREGQHRQKQVAEEQQRRQVQQRQLEESSRRTADVQRETQRRQVQAGEEQQRRQVQQRQLEESSRRTADAQRESQRRQQQTTEDQMRRQQPQQQRQPQRVAVENSRRVEQPRSSEDQLRSNRR